MQQDELTNNIPVTTEEIFIGMGGWEIQPFYNVFYPPRPGKDFRRLEYYSRFFDMVEVNATFYNTSLSQDQAKRWLDDVKENKRFIFTTKLFRGFTHTFDATQNDALAIHRLLEPLREAGKFGGLLAQFPVTFNKSNSRLNYIIKLRSMFPEDTLFLDLRHKSWGEESLHQFYYDNGLNLVNVDLPPLTNHIQFNALEWKGIAYFRLMGRNTEAWNNPRNYNRYLYNYNEEELKDILEKIRQISASKKYVVFHNDKQAFSLLNGKQIEKDLHPSKQILAPAHLLSAFPQLKAFCSPPAKEGDLFSEDQNINSLQLNAESDKPKKKKFKKRIVSNIPKKPTSTIKRRGFNR